jgi:hypothetical protein
MTVSGRRGHLLGPTGPIDCTDHRTSCSDAPATVAPSQAGRWHCAATSIMFSERLHINVIVSRSGMQEGNMLRQLGVLDVVLVIAVVVLCVVVAILRYPLLR